MDPDSCESFPGDVQPRFHPIDLPLSESEGCGKGHVR